ncbi:MAG: glycosyltransferase family 4 protein [Candidatus Omnitrophota bacterium]
MNILFVTSNFPPLNGGIANFDYNICKSLHQKGHKLVVLANSIKGSEKFDLAQGFEIIRLKGNLRPTSIEAISKLLYLVLKNNIDIVFFGHFGSTHWLGGVLSRIILKVPYVILVHGTEFNAYFSRFTFVDKWASGIVLKNAKGIIANSQVTRNLVHERGYPLEKIQILNPGVDVEVLKMVDKGVKMKEELKLNDNKILLTVARLVAKKNHENILKALAVVIKEVENVTYVILGEGEERTRLESLTRELGLEEYVKFLGQIKHEDIQLYYNICDIFVMPSKTIDIDYESFGIVYLEANACGKPVIAGKSGGVDDAVIDGVTGILVNPDDIDEISQAILCLLKDEKYAKELGENGRQRVEKEMNWNIAGNKIEMILNNVQTRA